MSAYRTSRQYDGLYVVNGELVGNGALYEDEESALMRAVDIEINRLQAMHRIAICALARALTFGVAIVSPLLPTDKTERDTVVSAARSELGALLLDAGIL
jgi:hypothetical protein